LFLIQLSTIPYFIWNFSSNRRPSFDSFKFELVRKSLINCKTTLCIMGRPTGSNPRSRTARASHRRAPLLLQHRWPLHKHPIATLCWAPLALPQRRSPPQLKPVPSPSSRFFHHRVRELKTSSNLPLWSALRRPHFTPRVYCPHRSTKRRSPHRFSPPLFPHHRRWSKPPAPLSILSKLLATAHASPHPYSSVQKVTVAVIQSASMLLSPLLPKGLPPLDKPGEPRTPLSSKMEPPWLPPARGGLTTVPHHRWRRDGRAAALAAALAASSVSIGRETVEENSPGAGPGRPHSHLVAGSRAGFGPSSTSDFLLHFWILVNSRNVFELLKFLENFRKIRKITNKFCGDPCRQIYLEILSTLSFSWYFSI
jgi:hypothetical protein